MGLNRKDIYLLEEISEAVFPIKYFAEEYSVSERNIRYSIDNINFYLNKKNLNQIEIKKGNLELNITREKLSEFIDDLNLNTYVFSQEERESYIIAQYLFEENPTIKEIENLLKISRTTIKKDIKNLESFLTQFEVFFERYENKIEISGNEKKLRHLKLLRMLDYAEIKNKKVTFIEKKYLNEKIESEIIKNYVNRFFKKDIVSVIDEIEKNLKTKFPEQFKNIMALYLIATLERIAHGYIIIRKSNSEFLRKVEEYKIIKKALGKIINENYEFEILHLTEYFLSGQYLNYFYENIFIAERFITRLLITLEKYLGVKLLESKELSEKLLQYLMPAIYRIKNNFCLHKELNYENIDKNILETVNRAVLENNKYLLEPLRDEEILYIAEYIEKFINDEKIKKISLKELLKIVQKNSKESNLSAISKEIKSKFSTFVNDDTENENYPGLSSLLTQSRIYISDKEIKFTEAAEIGMEILFKDGCLKETAPNSLKLMIENYGKYMFIMKKILLCYDTNSDNFLKSGLAMIVSEKGIKVNGNSDGNILFVLSAKNKSEHLKIISDLTNLAESDFFLQNVFKAHTAEKIIKIFS